MRRGQVWFCNANSRIKMKQIEEDKSPLQDAGEIADRWRDAKHGSFGRSYFSGSEVVSDRILLDNSKHPRATSSTRLFATLPRLYATGSQEKTFYAGSQDLDAGCSAVGNALHCLEKKASGCVPLQLTGA